MPRQPLALPRPPPARRPRPRPAADGTSPDAPAVHAPRSESSSLYIATLVEAVSDAVVSAGAPLPARRTHGAAARAAPALERPAIGRSRCAAPCPAAATRGADLAPGRMALPSPRSAPAPSSRSPSLCWACACTPARGTSRSGAARSSEVGGAGARLGPMNCAGSPSHHHHALARLPLTRPLPRRAAQVPPQPVRTRAATCTPRRAAFRTCTQAPASTCTSSSTRSRGRQRRRRTRSRRRSRRRSRASSGGGSRSRPPRRRQGRAASCCAAAA
jgi:hypothetical protein